jgi:hypothetical protein
MFNFETADICELYSLYELGGEAEEEEDGNSL